MTLDSFINSIINIYPMLYNIYHYLYMKIWNCVNYSVMQILMLWIDWRYIVFFSIAKYWYQIIITYYFNFSNSFNYLVILLDFISNETWINRIIWWCLRLLYGVLLTNHTIPFYNSFSSRFYMIPPFFTYDTSVLI